MLAMSWPCSRPGSSWLRSIACSPSASTHRRRCFSVITQPGRTWFTRMRSRPSSCASVRVRPVIADLQVA